MRTGIVADIHGNLVALETVLSGLERDPVDVSASIYAAFRSTWNG